MPQLPISRFIEELREEMQFSLLAGEKGLDRCIRHTKFQKNGLSLIGFLKNLNPDRVQVWGTTEMDYLDSMDAADQMAAVSAFFHLAPCAVVVLNGREVPEGILGLADETSVPIIRSDCEGQPALPVLERFLEARLSDSEHLHGVLVDLYGVGVLIQGKSGIGKSESALHLVTRGHRLVADDVVEIRLHGDELIGRSTDLLKHHMEVRGLGILNIKDLFGVVAIRYEKAVDLLVELISWDPSVPFERLGIDLQTRKILGETLPLVRIPVAPGRNVPTLIEVAARNLLLQRMGYHSAKEFSRSLMEQISSGSSRLPLSGAAREVSE